MIKKFSTSNWHESISQVTQTDAIQTLETGNILFFPQLAFELSAEEKKFLTTEYADPKAKNISYHSVKNKLWGVQHLTDEEHEQLKIMMERFAQCASALIKNYFPSYTKSLTMARTSFRPMQISDRKSSYRKDDKRLHIDAFPSAPNQGKRILRVFCNVNPHNEDRVWRVGEPFEKVANRFIPQIKKPLPGFATALRFLQITKSYRTPYDHYMLHMHDKMKADNWYQENCDQQEVRFAPNTTWIVQTDDVSHAAMKGQYLLEQTFSLPVHAMQDESRSPLHILEKILAKTLV
ncbi:MAG: hypothetical protein ACD_46C00655G0002 [uncultured bacterium]|nr:MAG: hypothetical protein ACD_46C00655G0002 [uncultured bacterium]